MQSVAFQLYASAAAWGSLCSSNACELCKQMLGTEGVEWNNGSAAGVQFLPQHDANATLGRAFRTRLLLMLLSCVCGLTLPACRNSQGLGNSNSDSRSTPIVISLTPPFATREPERYQAVRLITFSESASNPTNSLPGEGAKRVLTARDGEKRREEYREGSEQIIYLEIPAGRFVLLPASNSYAELNAVQERSPGNDLPGETAGISTDLLLNEEHAPTTYEKLGPETLEGRITTKYRVTAGSTSDQTAAKSETLIWIDEVLGMPVRSETTSTTSERSSRVITELKDVRLETEERLFALPENYKKVDIQIILDRIRGNKSR